MSLRSLITDFKDDIEKSLLSRNRTPTINRVAQNIGRNVIKGVNPVVGNLIDSANVIKQAIPTPVKRELSPTTYGSFVNRNIVAPAAQIQSNIQTRVPAWIRGDIDLLDEVDKLSNEIGHMRDTPIIAPKNKVAATILGTLPATSWATNLSPKQAANLSLYPVRTGAMAAEGGKSMVQGSTQIGAGLYGAGKSLTGKQTEAERKQALRDLGEGVLKTGTGGLQIAGSAFRMTPFGATTSIAENIIFETAKNIKEGKPATKYDFRGVAKDYFLSDALGIKETHPYASVALDVITNFLMGKAEDRIVDIGKLADAGKLAEAFDYAKTADNASAFRTKFKDYINETLNYMKANPELGAANFGAKVGGEDIIAQNKKMIGSTTEKPTDYRIQHQISSTNSRQASSLSNLDDIVKEAKVKYGYLTKYDLTDLNKLRNMQGNPDMEVKIYRASPVNELNSGDWVTTSKTYATDIKKQNGGKVFEYTVKASDLLYPNDLDELPSLARFSAFKYEPNQSKVGGDLLSEAKKYKSADEFVKSMSTLNKEAPIIKDIRGYKISDLSDRIPPTNNDGTITLYHATTKDGADSILKSGFKGSRAEEGNVFFTTDQRGGQFIGADKNTIIETKIRPEKLLQDISDTNRHNIVFSAKDTDIIGVPTKIVENPKPTTIESQLTDIWNQANKVGGGVKAQELDLGSQKVGKTQSTLQPQQEIVSTKSLEFPYKDIIPQQKLLPAGQPKVYTPNQAKAIFKRGGKVVPYKKTLKSGDSVINIPVGGWTGKKPYIEGKPITEVEAHQISQWEKEIGTKAYKKGIVSENFPSKALSTDNVNDKAALSYQRETIKRNVEETFGRGTKETDSVNKYFVEPITKNETERVWFVNKWKKDLTSKFKNLGIIKRGSAEDMAAADFIEGNITKEGLLTKFKGNTKKVDNIIKAAEIGRQEYRKLLKSINDTITLYGYKPIAEKQNYVTHTKQISELTNKFGSLINIPKDKLPTEMSAIHMDTKPGRQFFKFGQHRVGGSTHEGLITALDSYIEPASKQIYHTGDIQRGRALIDYMSKSSNGDTKLSNFNSYLSQYVDSLAGKKNVIDRPFEKVFGRRILGVGDWAIRRTGANMVGANVTSALTNYIPFTQSIATTSKPAVVKGLFEGLQSPFKAVDDIDGIKSEYLARNFLGEETLFPKFGESAVKKANILFDIVDKFTKRSVIAGKYFENISKGLSPEDAMKVADDYGARVLVDRSYGQTPIIFGSKTLGMFTQFQIEVNNQMSFLLKDVPKNFKYNKAQVASSLAQFAILSYVFNNLYEKVTGRRPQIDVIHLVESYAQGLEEGKEPAEMLNPTDSNTPVGEFVSNLPFNPAGGRLPIGAAIPNVLDVASGKSTIGAELKKPLYYLAPPVGGGQLKKTIEGVTAGSQGYSATKSGDMRYLIPENRKLQTAIFGQYSTPEARNYFESGGRPLSEKQTSYVKQAGDRGTAYQQIMNTREVNAKETKIKDKLKKSGGTEETENKIFYFDGEDVKSVKKKIALPKLTSNNELNKQILSDYKSDLTDYANYIVYQYESGAITEEKAGDELEKIVAYKKVATDITKAPKKAKKVDLAAISQKILKPVKVEVNTPKLNTFDILSGYSKIKAPTIEAPNLEVGVPKFDLPELTLPNFRKEL
jgi:hypothetical protein